MNIIKESTRAQIAIFDSPTEIRSHYSHYDGGNTMKKELNTYFNSEKEADFLVSSLNSIKAIDHGQIDRFDDENEAELYQSGATGELFYEFADGAINDGGADYIHLWKDGKWYMFSTDGGVTETAEKMKKEFNIEQEDMNENFKSKWDGFINEADPIPTTPGETEYDEDGNPHVAVMSNDKRKMAMRSVLDILKAELDVENDDAFVYIKTHRDELFDGTVDPFNTEEVVDDYNEFRLVNTEYVREEDNVEIDYSDATAGDDAIERESASGAFEEAYNARGETLKEQFKRLSK